MAQELKKLLLKRRGNIAIDMVFRLVQIAPSGMAKQGWQMCLEGSVYKRGCNPNFSEMVVGFFA